MHRRRPPAQPTPEPDAAGGPATPPEPWKRVASLDKLTGWILGGCAVAGAALALWAAFKNGKADWLMIAVLALAIVCVIAFSYRVTIDATGFTIARLWGKQEIHVPLAQISRVTVVQVEPQAQFGGYGAKTASDGKKGYNVRRGPGIQVSRKGGAPVVIAISRAEQGAARLKDFMRAARAQ